MTPTEQTVFIDFAVVWGSLAFLAGVVSYTLKLAWRKAGRDIARERAEAEARQHEQMREYDDAPAVRADKRLTEGPRGGPSRV